MVLKNLQAQRQDEPESSEMMAIPSVIGVNASLANSIATSSGMGLSQSLLKSSVTKSTNELQSILAASQSDELNLTQPAAPTLGKTSRPFCL